MKTLNVKLGLILLGLFVSARLSAQGAWTLEKCYELAIKNATFEKERSVRRNIATEKKQGGSTAFYPQVSLNGIFSTQSDVTKIPLPNIELPSREQYRVSLDLEQLVYDGGFSKRNNLLIDSRLVVDESRLEMVKSALKNQIADLYLGIILLLEKDKLIELYLKTLRSSTTQVFNQYKEGVALKSNVALMEAEILKVEQKSIANESKRQELLRVLSVLIGQDIDDKATFISPQIILEKPIVNTRAELKMFDAQKKMLGFEERLVGTQNNPKISLFASGGNALPGYNMLNPNADWFYIVGMKVTMPLTHWTKTRYEKSSLRKQQELVSLSKVDFLQRNAVEQVAALEKIEKFKLLLSKDDEIIAKRKEIAEAEQKRLLKGVATSVDYTTFLDAYQQSLLEKELHKIQLLKAKLEYQYIMGNN